MPTPSAHRVRGRRSWRGLLVLAHQPGVVDAHTASAGAARADGTDLSGGERVERGGPESPAQGVAAQAGRRTEVVQDDVMIDAADAAADRIAPIGGRCGEAHVQPGLTDLDLVLRAGGVNAGVERGDQHRLGVHVVAGDGGLGPAPAVARRAGPCRVDGGGTEQSPLLVRGRTRPPLPTDDTSGAREVVDGNRYVIEGGGPLAAV